MNTQQGKEDFGLLVRPSKINKHILAFIRNPNHSNAVINITGLTEGIFTSEWDTKLIKQLEVSDYSFVETNISGCFHNSCLSTLDKDTDELRDIIEYIKNVKKYNKITLIGHSTGSQTIMLYCKKFYEKGLLVDNVIFLCGVSDREYLETDGVDYSKLYEEAKLYRKEEKLQFPLSEKVFGLYITAYRFLSFYEKFGDDDMFSTDLTEEVLTPIFKGLKCPSLFIFGENDSFVPNKEALKKASVTFKNVAQKTSPFVEIKFLPGNHFFSNPDHQPALIDTFIDFIKTH